MAERGDDYRDLAEAVERGVPGDLGDGDDLRQRYIVGLGTWDAMITDLLKQIAGDAGSLRQALLSLSMLVDVAGSVAIAGDGELDPARQRGRYVVHRAPWLRMVADLLTQVVGDAGSAERAASVLAVAESSLLDWVCWFVSGGSIDAARSRWPVAPVGDRADPSAYLDLLEAVERDAVAGFNELDPPNVRDVYEVRLDSWERMEADLLGQIVADAGSIRRASKLIDMPRSTLGARLARARRRPP